MLKKIKVPAVFLIAFLIMAALSVTAVSAVDYGGNFWAKETIAILMERGVIAPDDDFGNAKPDQAITRAEVASAINKNFNFTRTTAINYTDVSPNDWFYMDLQIAFAMGYMHGDADGGFRPNANISREELSTVIGRILTLPGGAQFARDFFVDSSNIASWAVDHVGAMARERILEGYPNGEFRPANPVTRAEAYTILLRSEKTLRARNAGNLNLISARDVTENLSNREYMDLTITGSGVTLENIIVHGDLIISDEVRSGSVVLNNVQVSGVMYVRGGGSRTVIIRDGVFNDIVLNSSFNTRLAFEGSQRNASVRKIIVISSGAIDNQNTNMSPDISVAGGIASNAGVAIAGRADVVNINASASITFNGSARELKAGRLASGASLILLSDAVVDTLNIESPHVTVSNEGVINNTVIISSAGVTPTQLFFQNLTLETFAVTGTTLRAVFDRDIPGGLTRDDITVKGATFVSVTGSGRDYTITVSNITAGEVSVTVRKPGYHIRNATQSVNSNVMNFVSLDQNGSIHTTTTALTITFDRVVPGLAATDFMITGATRGALTGSGPVYTLAISNITVGNAQPISVTVAKSGFIFEPASKTVAVHNPPIEFMNVVANGSSSANTTQFILTFDREIPGGLAVSDISITRTNNTVAARVDAVNRVGTGNQYTVEISNISAGVVDNEEVRVMVSKSGYMFTHLRGGTPSQTAVRGVLIRKLPDIVFTNVTANGTDTNITAAVEGTTQLTLTFDRDIPGGLAVGDISVTRTNNNNSAATVTSVSRIGTTNQYTVNISNITIDDNAEARVTVTKSGYNIMLANGEAPTRNVRLRVTPANVIAWTSLTVNAANTQLSITFDKAVSGLTAANFTVSGATRGTLTQPTTANPTVYTLGISNVTGPIIVIVTRDNFTFTPNNRQANAPVADILNFTSANNTTVGQGQSRNFPVTATGVAPITYMVSGVPAGITVTVNNAGLMTITAAAAPNTVLNQQYQFTIFAIENPIAGGVISQIFTVTVVAQSAGGLPAIESGDNTAVTQGNAGLFPVHATGTAPIVYELINPPSGVSINSSTGIITIANTVTVGAHQFVIRIRDGASNTVSQNFTLTVNSSGGGVGGALAISIESPVIVTNYGVQALRSVTVTGGTGSYTYHLANQTAPTITMNGNIIVVGSNTPIGAGYSLTLTVIDSGGASVQQTIIIIVNP